MEVHDQQRRNFAGSHEEAQDAWRLYRHRTEHSPLPLAATEGGEHIIRYANPAFCNLVGRRNEDLVGRPFAEMLAGHQEVRGISLLDRVLETGSAESIVDEERSAEGDLKRSWAYSVWALVDTPDSAPGVMVQIADETERTRLDERRFAVSEALMQYSVRQDELSELAKKTQERLELAVRESEHRAKNSLQTISSMLAIQLRMNAGSVPALELAKIQLHIQTIATMHDILTYAKGTIPESATRDRLERLLPMWNTIAGETAIDWSIDNVPLSLQRSTALITVMNELVCNSVKYGADRIWVRLRREGDTVTLVITDNGPGWKEDIKPAEAGFGMKFVEAVSRTELRGELSYDTPPGGGARVQISFPVSEPLPDVSGEALF